MGMENVYERLQKLIGEICAFNAKLYDELEQNGMDARIAELFNAAESRDERFLARELTLIPYCAANNIGFVPFSPIASGLLSGKITTETRFESYDDVRNWVPQLSKRNIAGNQPIVDLLKDYAARKNATPAQISLAWMLHKYPNVVPIPGSKNKERIIENLDAANVMLTDAEFASLEESLNRCKVYGHRGFSR